MKHLKKFESNDDGMINRPRNAEDDIINKYKSSITYNNSQK